MKVRCLACTGGIGSGKSYVVRVFKALGIPAYIADERAKWLYDNDKVLLDSLSNLLGKEIIKNGKIDRPVMAKIIFNNPSLLQAVNDIVHPAVLDDYYKWSRRVVDSGAKFVIFESAIFLESPMFYKIASKVLVTIAPEDVRILRVIKRDGIDRERVLERMANQWSDELRKRYADFIIFADGKKAVLPQVLEIYEQLNRESESIWDMENGLQEL